MEVIQPRRGRRDSCTQITDGTVGTMIIESEKAICDSFAQTAGKFQCKNFEKECYFFLL